MGKWIPWLVAAFQIALVAGVCAFFWWRGLSIWAGLVIGGLAVVANSLFLRWEDKQPGGFDDV